MKLSKKLEAEVMEVYDAYWKNYLQGNVEGMIPLLDEEYTQVGSAETEVFFNKKDAVTFLYDTIGQVAEKLEMRNRNINIEKLDTTILVHDLCDVYVLTENEWTFYSKFRASTLLQEKYSKWKIIHQHSSMPDVKTEDGENIAIEKISKENIELRDAVKRRTIELENKNHELEIEGSLERVRAQALSMKKPDDLPGICEILFEELIKLGFSELRNSMINIHDDEKNSFLNYDFSDSIGKSITLFNYDTHPLVERQIKQIRSGVDAFSETCFSGPELQEWKAFRKKKGEKDDPRLENISALYYYFYSIGNGSIGISTFGAITEEKLNVLKRFRNVFDFAYRRYLEVKQAETQAREAQIEVALERVRSKALAMQRSADLAAAVNIVFDELDKLNLGMIRCGIGILNREHRSANVWTTGISEHGMKAQVSGDESLDIHPLLQGAYEAWINQKDFSYLLKDDDLIQYYKALENTNFHLPEVRSIVEQAKIQPLQQFYYVAPFESGNLFAFRETEFSEEAKKVIRRFSEVFNLTYTRFLDLQKAEAQAKESQIERKRSEDLLLNILPLEIANELKQFGKSYARKHEEVTILFADIKGFSSIAEDLSAEDLVWQLDDCFRAFDKIVEKHGLEKIKTVGDAYICACGLPKPVYDNAVKTVRAAIDMLDFLKGFGMSKQIQGLPVFDFRFGIHTGPVVTGVVGLKKFTYDIWGDAVNMAARMEQHGEPGKINVSGSTYQFIKDTFKCIHRGKIEAKNKGEVDMYFVDHTL